jgi:flagellar assembly protein FliH
VPPPATLQTEEVNKPGQDGPKNGFNKISIKNESDVTETSVRVMKIDTASAPVVQQFNFGRLQRAGAGSYAATKEKYGALAATDAERTERGQKDRRFSLNPLLKEPLSIEEEERRVIDAKVSQQVAALAEAAKSKAAEEGYQAGLKQGHAEAYEAFRQEASGRMTHFEEFLASAEQAKTEIFRANERFLMELVFRMARTVALKELSVDRTYVLRLARDLLERIGIRENIRIRIHPQDAATAELLKPGLEEELGTLKNLHVEISPQVGRGGCMVETEWNMIDASLETQFAGIYEALLGVKAPATATKTDIEPPAVADPAGTPET